MQALFRHLDAITRGRQRSVIEMATMEAFHQLLDASLTRLYKVFLPPGDILAGLSAEVQGRTGQVASFDDGFSWPRETSSIERFPQLQRCFAVGEMIRETLPNGHEQCTLLMRDGLHEPYAFLQLERAAALDAAALLLIDGLATVMRNGLAMLEYSETDTLTRLLNRKTFDEYLINILANIPEQDDVALGALHLPQRRQAHPQARDHWLGVMDIDKFKSINDRFGHLIGDEVLILMANLMRESFRVQDKLFRFGGEEFIALLRPAQFEHALGTFERFRKRVEAFEFPQVGHVTVSVGFSRIKHGDTPSLILDTADEALYWAKEHGRNQCHAYEVLLAEGKLQKAESPVSDVELF